jgi:hypothetical protein
MRVEIAVVGREAVEEAAPDHPRGFIGSFLVNLLKEGFTLTP